MIVSSNTLGISAARAEYLQTRRDWRGAFGAVKKLFANSDDTAQVFNIMRALNVGSAKANYRRLVDSVDGGRIAFEHVELVDRLRDPAYVASFAPGTVGAAYRRWLEHTGFSADGLADVSKTEGSDPDEDFHPYAWSGRRMRDLHDIWHVLTGYKADEDFGEVCIVAFSYAQLGGLGWAFIAGMATLKHLRSPFRAGYVRAVWEAYRLGRRAKWLMGENYEMLLAEPIDAARTRLGLTTPHHYLAIRDTVSAAA